MCHISFKVERTWYLLCFAFILPSMSVFTQWETNWKTPSFPSPFCDHIQELAPPSPLTIAWSNYLVFLWSSMPPCQSFMLFYT